MAQSYMAYTLRVQSAISLPELMESAGSPEVTIQCGQVTLPPDLIVSGLGLHAVSEGAYLLRGSEAYLFYEGVAVFRVRHGNEIAVEPVAGVDGQHLRTFLLGQVLGILLHQRGLLVLHASAVQVNGAAAAFLGGSRWGKSTLAAALHSRGYRLVADDLLPIRVGAGAATVLPAFPQFKLWPDALRSLGADPERHDRFFPGLDKRIRPVASADFASQPMPLHCIYALSRGETTAIEPIRPGEGVVELLRHSIAYRQQTPDEAGRHFQQCAAVAASVPLRRLARSRSIDPAGVAALVERDLESVARRPAG